MNETVPCYHKLPESHDFGFMNCLLHNTNSLSYKLLLHEILYAFMNLWFYDVQKYRSTCVFLNNLRLHYTSTLIVLR